MGHFPWLCNKLPGVDGRFGINSGGLTNYNRHGHVIGQMMVGAKNEPWIPAD